MLIPAWAWCLLGAACAEDIRTKSIFYPMAGPVRNQLVRAAEEFRNNLR